MSTLYLKTIEQAAIWKHEIVGQLSDGAWENTLPYDHWKFWGKIVVEVSKDKFGVSQFPLYNRQKRNYQLTTLTNPEFVDLSDRMRAYAVMARLKNTTDFNRQVDYLVEPLHANYDSFVAKLKSYTNNPEYYQKIIDSFSREEVDEFYVVYPKYTRLNCIEDLRTIKKAMKTDCFS